MFNFYWESVPFEVPSPPLGFNWRKVIDTSADPGFWEESEAPLAESSLSVPSRSLIVLVESP
ncbi:MAG: hypothetical protein HKM06_01085 [Spirochaetales bacterium]|nr:hypothetical protein [Spirochaetales bacterium]